MRAVQGVSDWDVREACDRIGVTCLEVAVPEEELPSDEVVERVIHLLARTGLRTLMFCEDGSRCAMLFAIHRVVNEHVPLEDALTEARRAGMPNTVGEAFVRAQVERNNFV